MREYFQMYIISSLFSYFSLRAQYGTENFVNALHGSDSTETSMRELAFFFPNFVGPTVPGGPASSRKVQRTLALIRPDALRDRKGSCH